MWVVLGAGVPAAIGLALFFVERALRARWRDGLQWEHDRYRLRVRVPGAKGERTAIARRASPAPVSVARELVDDFERVVQLPGGQALDVEGADGVTANGADFEVPAGTPFWILDVPPAHLLARDAETGAATIPPRREAYRVTTGSPPLPSDLERRVGPPRHWVVAAAGVFGALGAYLLWRQAWLPWGLGVAVFGGWLGARLVAWVRAPRLAEGAEVRPGLYTNGMIFAAPLWAAATDSASDWLCGRKDGREARVMVFDLTMPGSPPGVDPEDEQGGLVAVELAEALWTQTSIAAGARIEMVRGRARVYSTHVRTWKEVRSACEHTPCLAIWGEYDVREGVITLHLRERDGDAPERVLQTTRAGIAADAIQALGELGVATRRAAPEWHGAVPEVARARYEAVIDRAILLRMRTAGVLPRANDAEVGALVADARELAREVERARQLTLLWLNCAAQADLAGQLPAAEREIVSATLRDASDASDPVARLAPLWLERFGWKAEAAARCRRLAQATQVGDGAYREGPDPYAQWLRRIEERCREPDAA